MAEGEKNLFSVTETPAGDVKVNMSGEVVDALKQGTRSFQERCARKSGRGSENAL